MNVSAKAKWKSVPMDPQLKARGFSEGLLGIEELCDYDLLKVKKNKLVSVEGSKVTKKRKKLEEPSVVSDITDAKKQKVKKKEKEKKKKKNAEENAEPSEKRSDDEDKIINENSTLEMPGWKEFNLPSELLKALHALNFDDPTPIQRETLPAAINGHADIVGAAETGSGKTLAFGIPILTGILNDRNMPQDQADSHEDDLVNDKGEDDEVDMEDPDAESGCVRVVNNVEFDFEVDFKDDVEDNTLLKKGGRRNGRLRALILTPTRELAIQVRNHLQALAKFTDIKIVAIVGGMAVQKQIRLLGQAPEIIVATPGRLWDIYQEGHPHLSQLAKLAYLAIDETDRMIEKGHFAEMQNLLEVINNAESKNKRRQTFVFSATLSLIHELPKHVAGKKGAKKLTSEEKLKELMNMVGVKSRPKIVDLTRKIGTAETLTESRINCSIKDKDFYLYYFLQQHPGRTIVFCNSIDCVRRLVNLFGLLCTEPLGLHAQMHQKQRLKNLERFTANEEGFMVATDVAARGLDIPNVEHVVHYQVPRTSESYVHRSGRTARAKKEGLSVMLIDPSENQFYRRMCRTLNRDEDLGPFPVEDQIITAIKLRVNTARSLDKLLLDQRKEEAQKNWLKKAAEEAELEISDDDDFNEDNQQKKADLKVKIKSTKAKLATLLASPLHTQDYGGKYPTMSGTLKFPTDFRSSRKAIKAMKVGFESK